MVGALSKSLTTASLQNIKNPVLHRQNGVLCLRGGNCRQASLLVAELGLEVLAGRKLYALGSLDLDLVTSLRIDTSACLTSSNLECPETDELNRATFLQTALDPLDHSVKRTLSLGWLSLAFELGFFF